MKFNVLIVERDKTIRGLYHNMLKEHCDKIVTAATNDDALKAITDNPETNLAIIDLNLPIGDGFDLVKEISSKYHDILMVALISEPVDEKGGEELLSMGVLGFLFKPTPENEFLNYFLEIKEIYKKRQSTK